MPISKKITLPGGVCISCVKFSSCLYSDQLSHPRENWLLFYLLHTHNLSSYPHNRAHRWYTHHILLLYSLFFFSLFPSKQVFRLSENDFFQFFRKRESRDGKCLTWLDRKRNPLICLGSQLLQGFQKPKTNMMNKWRAKEHLFFEIKNWICYFDFIHDAFWPLEHLKFSLCMHLAKNLRHNPNHKKLRIKHLSFCAPSGIFKLCNRSFSFLWIHIKSYDLCYSGAGWRCRGFEIYWLYHYYI